MTAKQFLALSVLIGAGCMATKSSNTKASADCRWELHFARGRELIDEAVEVRKTATLRDFHSRSPKVEMTAAVQEYLDQKTALAAGQFMRMTYRMPPERRDYARFCEACVMLAQGAVDPALASSATSEFLALRRDGFHVVECSAMLSMAYLLLACETIMRGERRSGLKYAALALRFARTDEARIEAESVQKVAQSVAGG